jgi:hypothetical protein
MICMSESMEHKKFPCLFLIQQCHIHFCRFIYMVLIQDLPILTIYKYFALASYTNNVPANKKL